MKRGCTVYEGSPWREVVLYMRESLERGCTVYEGVPEERLYCI